MTQIALALAKFARAQGDLYLNLAADLEAVAQVPDLTADAEVEIPTGRGQRQQQILAVPGLSTENGMKTADIAAAISYDGPNTHTSLQALHKAGLVEPVPGASPQRWRLAPRYRTTSVVFMRMASRVREGEWTTYGDISIAVRGDTKAARGVGQAAAALANFPHPERILMEGGRINPKWRDSQNRGPEYCRQLLESQGVRFDNDLADAHQRVTWDELRRRDESEPVTE
ncbi:MGMT family protein [Micromonospora sp. HUAS LYJ1]|uniref:MGMT family protein n=1 Tax=Micromonospora sp. HUAS LYJ1 TaxID=3061626 RepID=UPI002673C31D|nr:MGMT family protein [Micromonospora sp. HUAS LYJ1]WKU07063.1 MGMT family protein [Micromonospora sp. HUAS LYJ1]